MKPADSGMVDDDHAADGCMVLDGLAPTEPADRAAPPRPAQRTDVPAQPIPPRRSDPPVRRADLPAQRTDLPAQPTPPRRSDPPAVHPGSARPELTARDREILAFERKWWRHAGAKEQAIRDAFDLSATRYYQVLNGLLDNPAALAHDPVLVGRLRRLRSARVRSGPDAGRVG